MSRKMSISTTAYFKFLIKLQWKRNISKTPSKSLHGWNLTQYDKLTKHKNLVVTWIWTLSWREPNKWKFQFDFYHSPELIDLPELIDKLSRERQENIDSRMCRKFLTQRAAQFSTSEIFSPLKKLIHTQTLQVYNVFLGHDLRKANFDPFKASKQESNGSDWELNFRKP